MVVLGAEGIVVLDDSLWVVVGGAGGVTGLDSLTRDVGGIAEVAEVAEVEVTSFEGVVEFGRGGVVG